MGVIILQ